MTTEAPPQPQATSWEAIREPAYADTGGEFLLHTDDEPQNGVLDELRNAILAGDPRETVQRVCGVIPDRFEYRPGATFVGSTVDDLLEGGAGVCQDFVHLALILLRNHGIAARYVSGYLFAAPDDGGEDSVEVDTHAWLEALLPGRRRTRLGGRRPDQPAAGRRGARQDRPRPLLRRRGPDPRRLQGRGEQRGARRQRQDDAPRLTLVLGPKPEVTPCFTK